MIRKIVCMLIVILGVVAGVHAQPDDTIYGLVSVDRADVRIGPDFAYDSIGQLPLDASVVVLGRVGYFYYRWDSMEWLQIRFGDRIGWIYARLLRTSVPFNAIPLQGEMLLPRDRNGRVPEEFDLSSDVCSQWTGSFGQSGNSIAKDAPLSVTYPGLTGANVYSVLVISPTGFRTSFDSETTTATIEFEYLPAEAGTYTWQAAPYWSNEVPRYTWQQVCLLQTGGTFEKPAS
ncbi:MAG: SH3 domain-containing protein [Anaerolineae bacterium]|nr:SH3 domain-containing protein [Anaerolineae bacterium]